MQFLNKVERLQRKYHKSVKDEIKKKATLEVQPYLWIA
jgi:hypothetical protein